MSGRRVIQTGFLVSLLVAATIGPSSLQAQGRSQSRPLAEVNGQVITEEEVDSAIAAPLAKLQEQIYNLRRQRVEATIRDRLLAQEAARRGISVQKLLDTEVTFKVGLVSEEEIERRYQASKGQSKADVDEATIRDQIRGRTCFE
jgi:SurA-like N-terminal domain